MNQSLTSPKIKERLTGLTISEARWVIEKEMCLTVLSFDCKSTFLVAIDVEGATKVKTITLCAARSGKIVWVKTKY